MQQITSSYVKKVRSLHTKKGRSQFKQFIGQGVRTCETLIADGVTLEKLIVTEQHLAWAQSLTPTNTIVLVHDDSIIKKMATTQTPSGVIGVFCIPTYPLPDHFEQGLVLARVSDPGNAGTLLRSAAAFGVSTVLCIETVDPWSPKVVQASAGTIGSVRVYSISWNQLLQHKGTTPLYALVVTGGVPLDSIEKKSHLLVIGSEAHGIPTQWLGQCQTLITIAMAANTESLNAAVAGSIALYTLQEK